MASLRAALASQDSLVSSKSRGPAASAMMPLACSATSAGDIGCLSDFDSWKGFFRISPENFDIWKLPTATVIAVENLRHTTRCEGLGGRSAGRVRRSKGRVQRTTDGDKCPVRRNAGAHTRPRTEVLARPHATGDMPRRPGTGVLPSKFGNAARCRRLSDEHRASLREETPKTGDIWPDPLGSAPRDHARRGGDCGPCSRTGVR